MASWTRVLGYEPDLSCGRESRSSEESLFQAIEAKLVAGDGRDLMLCDKELKHVRVHRFDSAIGQF
jgi:hypothetical protein